MDRLTLACRTGVIFCVLQRRKWSERESRGRGGGKSSPRALSCSPKIRKKLRLFCRLRWKDRPVVASSLAFCDHFSSSKQTFRRLPAFELGIDTKKPCKQVSTKKLVHYCSSRIATLQLLDDKVFKSTDLHAYIIVERPRWTFLGPKSASGRKVRGNVINKFFRK